MPTATEVKEYAKERDRIARALKDAGVVFTDANPRRRSGLLQLEISAGFAKAEETLAAGAPSWEGLAKTLEGGGAMQVGRLMVGRSKVIASTASGETPEALVEKYVAEADQVTSWTKSFGPERLPSGPALLALGVDDRAKAMLPIYRALPTARTMQNFGRRFMLGSLALRLVRADLPLTDQELETLLAIAARVVAPSMPNGPDYHLALLKLVEARRASPRMKASIKAIRTNRDGGYAGDKKLRALCDKLL